MNHTHHTHPRKDQDMTVLGIPFYRQYYRNRHLPSHLRLHLLRVISVPSKWWKEQTGVKTNQQHSIQDMEYTNCFLTK